MFKEISKISYKELMSFIGKNLRFTSDCEFFPNFDVSGKVLSIDFGNNENIIYIKTEKRIVHIGTNMKNLKFEYLGE